jgi:16S rRNA (cytidine1402-2'-O)-methyltransferase
LTKQYEEFILGRLGALSDAPLDVLGEVTVIIGPEALGPPPAGGALDGGEPGPQALLEAVMAEERARGGKPREVARRVAERIPGLGVKEAYELLKG